MNMSVSVVTAINKYATRYYLIYKALKTIAVTAVTFHLACARVDGLGAAINHYAQANKKAAFVQIKVVELLYLHNYLFCAPILKKNKIRFLFR